MSIATEITRLQGIKTDIRSALVTQGISVASTHNMADFSTDILAIQGGSEGVYITVTCARVYYNATSPVTIYLKDSDGNILDFDHCPSSLEVSFFVSADDITLPATFTISNSLNSKTTSVSANMYGWYNDNLDNIIIELIPNLSTETALRNKATASSTGDKSAPAWKAFDRTSDMWWALGASNQWIQYQFTNPMVVKKLYLTALYSSEYRVKDFMLQGSNDNSKWDDLFKSRQTYNNSIGGEQIFNTDKNNTIGYLYYRLYIYDSYINGNISVQEMQLYGYEE